MDHIVDVTVVMPAYNASKYIKKSLECIFNQTVKPKEVLVIDDGSTDTTVNIAKEFPVRIINQNRQGPGAARNKGVAEATSEWIAFLDADDLWLNNKLEKYAPYLNGEEDFISSDVITIDQNNEERVHQLHKRVENSENKFLELFKGNYISTITVLIRKKTFIELGGMDVTLKSAQDYDLWLRVAEKKKTRIIPEALSIYIFTEGSITTNIKLREKCIYKILDKHKKKVPYSVYIYRLYRINYELFGECFNRERYLEAAVIMLKFPFQLIRRLVRF